MYKVIVLEKVIKYLKDLDRATVQKIWAKINALQDDPRPHYATKLVGASAYRMRVADFRIIYYINDAEVEVLVVEVENRNKVYRKNK